MNAFEPVMFHNLFESCQLLTKACQIFADKCVAGITVNETACSKAVNNSTGLLQPFHRKLVMKSHCFCQRSIGKNCSIEELLKQEEFLRTETYQ